jgi:thiamine pyrophosphokinase
MRTQRALILANGDRPPASFLRTLRRDAGIFIAADGAANRLGPEDPVPDYVLGDFDSLDPGARERLTGPEFVLAEDQELSDLEKAVRHALDLGARQITITGATGSRPDHTLTAFSILAAYPDDVTRMVEPLWQARAVSVSAVIAGRPGDTLSLTVFAPATVRSLDGVQWPLRDETLVPGSRGISNRMIGIEARLVVDAGIVIVAHVRPELARQ